MIEWTFIIKTTIAMIAIVDPPGCLPIYLSLTSQHKKINKKNVAKMTALTVFIILVVSLFLGDKILNIFGISMPSFQICGGILLLIMAIYMMLGRNQVMESTQNKCVQQHFHAVMTVKNVAKKSFFFYIFLFKI